MRLKALPAIALPAIALLLGATQAAAQKQPVTPASTRAEAPPRAVSSVVQPHVMLAGEPIVYVGGTRREFHTTMDSTAPWVAGADGLTYYRRDCYVAKGVLPGGHVYFKTEKDAYVSDYRHSTIPGCYSRAWNVGYDISRGAVPLLPSQQWPTSRR
jgi:hypothetical protein